jgi:folate-binding Fe-S cluster repair protein YgfZ
MRTYSNASRIASIWLKANEKSIPAKACALLKDRGFIRLHGPYTYKFLQGIVTQNVDLLNTFSGLYTGLLTNTGRILGDVFIYRSNIREELFLDCDASHTEYILQHLQRYKLDADVEIDDVTSEYVVWSVWSDSEINPIPNLIGLSDPRCPDMGFRYLISSKTTREAVLGNHPILKLPILSTHIYHCRRILLGIPEGKSDFLINESFPMEYNLDFMNGSKNASEFLSMSKLVFTKQFHFLVNFNKGCYLGQELTARTHFRGTVRKRIVPIQLLEKEEASSQVD